MSELLPRNVFREQVFARDNHTCVVPNCGKPAQDAHHILERKLWSDGGYYLDNGASVCAEHHMKCETTEISVEEIREYAKIQKPVIPDHMYDDIVYDKWGNTILPNGMRTKGELFHDESVQKVLASVLDLFTDYVKYPRTFHAPWSFCVHSDDKVIPSTEVFANKRVIVTEKMDGENTTLYRNYYHARSVDSKNHESRNLAKALHAKFAYDIPEGWRICCENLYMVHSIKYEQLESVLYGLSVWNDTNMCLDWEETQTWFELLGLPHPKILYDGIYNENLIKGLYDNNRDWYKSEGLVVRVADSFHFKDFKHSVMKVVRKNHVQTTKHCLLAHNIEVNNFSKMGKTVVDVT